METLPPGGGSALANGLRNRSSTSSLASCNTATFRMEGGLKFTLCGKRAIMMQKLIAARRIGVTQLDVVLTSIRLSSIIFDLRHRQGLEIHTVMEPNSSSSGLHARYFLISKVSACEV